jgi:hypothetical protein
MKGEKRAFLWGWDGEASVLSSAWERIKWGSFSNNKPGSSRVWLGLGLSGSRCRALRWMLVAVAPRTHDGGPVDEEVPMPMPKPPPSEEELVRGAGGII